MQRVAQFEKVSFNQFDKDFKDTYGDKYDVNAVYESIKLPKRATSGSAGYDFYKRGPRSGRQHGVVGRYGQGAAQARHRLAGPSL